MRTTLKSFIFISVCTRNDLNFNLYLLNQPNRRFRRINPFFQLTSVKIFNSEQNQQRQLQNPQNSRNKHIIYQMRVTVLSESAIAAASHRNQEEYIEVDMRDTVEDIRVKITTVYDQLDPEQFVIRLNNRVLKKHQLMSNLVKESTSQNGLTFVIHQPNCFTCNLI